jgi:hypothetical protein
VQLVSADGNATINIDGTSNVAVFGSTGANITGTLGVSGNVSGNYFIGNGSQLTIQNKFLTPSKFALEIEKIVVDEKLNYIDSICYYCEMNSIEVESVAKLISKPLKEKLKWDATRLNFMKKTSRAKLPL